MRFRPWVPSRQKSLGPVTAKSAAAWSWLQWGQVAVSVSNSGAQRATKCQRDARPAQFGERPVHQGAVLGFAEREAGAAGMQNPVAAGALLGVVRAEEAGGYRRAVSHSPIIYMRNFLIDSGKEGGDRPESAETAH